MNSTVYTTEEDLRNLPVWACVAFAARCGRRVQPLLRKFWRNAPLDLLKVFDDAIALAERSAAEGAPATGLEEAVQAAQAYGPAMVGPLQFRAYGAPPAPVAQSQILRYSLGKAALAGVQAATFAGAGDRQACAHCAFEAYGWAYHAALNVHVAGLDNVMHYDLVLLMRAVERGELSESSPVPPEFFALEKELRTYERLLPALQADQGRYALIHGDQLAGTWATYEDALQAGYERFGLTPFLVKQISDAAALPAQPNGEA